MMSWGIPKKKPPKAEVLELFFYTGNFEIKYQISARRNHIARSSFSITQMRWNKDAYFIAYFHAQQGLFKSADQSGFGGIGHGNWVVPTHLFSLGIKSAKCSGDVLHIGVKNTPILKVTSVKYFGKATFTGYGSLTFFQYDHP